MAAAKSRAKLIVEAAVSEIIEKSPIHNTKDHNLQNVAGGTCPASDLQNECINSHENIEVSTSVEDTSFKSSRMNNPISVNGTDSDIIEDSQDEPIYSSILCIQNKKQYTVLQNVSHQHGDDFSSGSDDIYNPQIPSSSSSCGIVNWQEDIIIPSTSNQIECEDIEENNMPTKKRKIFPPKENKSKKRPRNEQSWKKKSAAIARAKGEEYVSYKGETVPKKTIQEGLLCHENCRLKCSSKFSLEDRKTLLSSYYTLDSNSKNALLFSSIVSKPVARQRTNARKHKSASYKYYVKNQGITQEICKLGLCGVYQIGRKKIDLIIKDIKNGLSAPKPDRRGRHQNRPHKMDEDVIQRIKEHISSFPAEQSHYSRNKNMFKLYLSPLLNVTKMHSLYLELCQIENLPNKYRIKKSSYNKIFVTEFNLSYGYPKSDTCSTCDAGESNEEHKANYYAAVEAMQTDRKKPTRNGDIVYVTIDLQQTMPLPKLTVSKAFYLRQMWFYNLGIHVNDSGKEKAVCCTWTEDVADRGSIEVASALLRFVEVDPSCQNKDHLLIWSDSCAGQNKNFNMIALYQYLIRKQKFKVIDHKFPEVGHTYLDSDRDFGRIEKKLRKHDTVYVPDQYRSIIGKASRNNTVIDMTDHFRKINELQEKLTLINRKKDVNNEKVCFRDRIKWIRVDEFGSYLYKETYDEMTPFKKVDILKKRSQVPDGVEIPRVNGKYGSISVEKRENLREQLKFVKPEYRYFYEAILNNQD